MVRSTMASTVKSFLVSMTRSERLLVTSQRIPFSLFCFGDVKCAPLPFDDIHLLFVLAFSRKPSSPKIDTRRILCFVLVPSSCISSISLSLITLTSSLFQIFEKSLLFTLTVFKFFLTTLSFQPTIFNRYFISVFQPHAVFPQPCFLTKTRSRPLLPSLRCLYRLLR